MGKRSFLSRGLKQLASGLGVQKRRNTWRATKLDSWRSGKNKILCWSICRPPGIRCRYFNCVNDYLNNHFFLMIKNMATTSIENTYIILSITDVFPKLGANPIFLMFLLIENVITHSHGPYISRIWTHHQ